MTSIYIRTDTALPERKNFDLYETESSLIRALFDYNVCDLFPQIRASRPGSNSLLDVGAGDGRWGLIANEMWPKFAILDGIDIRDLPKPPYFTGWFPCQDFTTWDTHHRYAIIVGNPPYYLAEKFVEKAWDLLTPGGSIVFLLRLAFLEGVGRHESFWPKYPLTKVYVCSRRPSFYGGKTNGTAFGVFHWQKTELFWSDHRCKLGFLNYSR